MKKIVKGFIKLLVLLFVLFLMSSGIDYLRMRNGKLPMFCMNTYNPYKNIQMFINPFYTAERKVRASIQEPLVDSSKVSFRLLYFNLPIERKYVEEKENFTISTKEISNCEEKAKLYYADLFIKVYTYCLDDISIKVNDKSDSLLSYLKKDITILDDIDSKLAYKGLVYSTNTQEFISRDDINITNLGLKMYRCNDTNVNDVTIGPLNMEYDKDFCTYKDDDFEFLWTVTDETPTDLKPILNEKGETIPEVIFEDTDYRYEFEVPKSNYVFVTTPEVRGKKEVKIPIRDVLTNNLLTIDELQSRGLVCNKIDKKKEAEEKKKKEEEEKEKLEEEQKNNQE